MTDVIPFKFHEDELLLVDVDGKPLVLLRPVIEHIGLSYSSQLQKLKNKSWASMSLVNTQVGDQRQQREQVAISVKSLLMLLATVDENKVAEHVRPKLIAYQSEVADAIEAYWTKGGVVNPRASEDQLSALIARAEGQAKVLSALRGVVDKGWLDAKGRHIAARALGEEPEIDPATRPLTVGEYLEKQGVTGAALRSLSPKFGKRLKAAYVDRYDRPPTVADRFIDGALRPVAVYTERHRPLFDLVWRQLSEVTV